jgi:hypothetical protein
MKSSKLICKTLCALALSAAVLVAPSRTAQAEPTGERAERLESCDHYMTAYARSAARKLSRALSGQKYTSSKLPEKNSLEIAPAGQLELLFESDRAAAGVVEKTRTHRTTYVVANYEIGPVVAVHHWPSRDAIASGKACKPVSSSIAFPDVPVATIDVEPFKFWGLRVVWHIPTDLSDKVTKTAPLDALRAVIEATD